MEKMKRIKDWLLWFTKIYFTYESFSGLIFQLQQNDDIYEVIHQISYGGTTLQQVRF